MASVHPILLASLVLVGLGAVLQIVGLATPDWTVVEVEDRHGSRHDARVGPFRYCNSVGCGASPNGIRDDIDAVKAMTLLGMLFSFFSGGAILYMVFLYIRNGDKRPVLPFAAVACATLSFVFVLIGVLVWSLKVDTAKSEPGHRFGYSFALSIVGGVIVLLTGVALLVGRRKYWESSSFVDIMASVHPILFASLALVGLGAVLQIVGLATPDWTVMEVEDQYGSRYDARVGPFRYCERMKGGYGCAASPNGVRDDVDAVKAMTLLGMLFSFFSGVAILCMVFLCIRNGDKRPVLPFAAVACATLSFVFVLIGILVWSLKVDTAKSEPGHRFGYSFALSIVGGVIVLLTGVPLLLGRKKYWGSYSYVDM